MCIGARGPGLTTYAGAMPTWPVAAGSLVLGFVVAQATGVRPLGGLVLLAGAGWCVARWRRAAGVPGAAVLLLVYATAFALSHVVADALGTWGAVALAAAVTGLAAWAVADRVRPPAAAPAAG